VLVLEGAARRGRPAGREGALRTVHASGSGDDALVEEVAALLADGPERCAEVLVVTADRGLRSRVEALGARCLGPSWLLDRT